MSESPAPRTHQISRVLAGGLFALFCALFIQGLTVFGVIAVNSGHVFIFFAWLVGSLTIFTEILPGKPTRHRIAWIVALGITLLVIDVVCAMYASKQSAAQNSQRLPASPTPILSPSVSPSPIQQSSISDTEAKKKELPDTADTGNRSTPRPTETPGDQRTSQTPERESEHKPSPAQVEQWVRSLYPEGTRMSITRADDSRCGDGCQKFTVVLRSSGEQTRNESVTVTYHFAKGRWVWNGSIK